MTLPAYPSLSGYWWTQLAVALACLLTAGVVWVRRAAGPALIEASAFVALALVGVMIAVTAPVGMVPSFLFWPVVALAYFSSRRVVVAALITALAVLGGGLLLNPYGYPEAFAVAAGELVVLTWLVHSMTRRQADLRAELTAAADTDPLTGVLNRRAFHPRLAALVAEAVRDGEPLSLVMLDLDHFKRINDTHGHPAGDAVLAHLGAALREVSRSHDVLARLGGEEFAAALPGADVAAAGRFAARVADRLAASPVPGVSTSAGICGLGAGVLTVEALLGRADEALYAAKQAGRGRPARWSGTVVVGEPFAGELRTASG